MQMSAKVSGLTTLRKRFEQLPKNIEASVMAAMAKGTAQIAQHAKLLAPRDEGDLIASIHTTAPHVSRRRPDRLVASVVAGRRTPDGFNTARLVEFGTSDTPTQPFMYPALRTQRRSVQSGIVSAVKRAARES